MPTPPAPRSIHVEGTAVKKDKYQCRGLRRWCYERCEQHTKTEPRKYPFIGYYCPLHAYQKPDAENEYFVEIRYQRFLERLDSYRPMSEAVEEEQKQSATRDNDVAVALKVRTTTPHQAGTTPRGAQCHAVTRRGGPAACVLRNGRGVPQRAPCAVPPCLAGKLRHSTDCFPSPGPT